MSDRLRGTELPAVVTPLPGPRSRALLERLTPVESRNITAHEPPPIFWSEAVGAAVRDADDNVYVDLTAGFGVAHAGHANPAVAAAVAGQMSRLAHGLGDVHPPEPKVRLLERLAEIAPGTLSVSILANSGSEAVEAALKTARMRTGRSGIIAFEGGYHGLTYGALAVTHRADFRDPFLPQIFDGVHFAPFASADGDVAAALAAVSSAFEAAESSPHPVGAVIIEPMLGRGGLLPAAPAFLRGLRDLCDGRSTLLLFDEVYTGCGRTGRWFAADHYALVPDVLVVGKALSGSIPISAAIGTPEAMSGWPPSAGEAIHTSTFLGNPVACAAALAQLEEVERLGLHERSVRLGDLIRQRAQRWHERMPAVVGPPRGLGLLSGVPLLPAGGALRVCDAALTQGVIVLAEGPAADILAITPPAAIGDDQLTAALDVLENALVALSRT